MRKYTETERAYLSNHMLETVKNLITLQIPFSLAIDNWNNWDEKFPEKLREKDRFMINIKEQALEDSYADESDNIVIVIDIQGLTYTKKLDISDIHAISFDVEFPPFMLKNYKDKPEIKEEKKELKVDIDMDDEGIKTSMNAFRKYNKELFNAK